MSHNLYDNANPEFAEKHKSFNEKADPAWHWVTPTDRLNDYQDRQDLINKTKLDVLEKD